jgi:hypothetical protein
MTSDWRTTERRLLDALAYLGIDVEYKHGVPWVVFIDDDWTTHLDFNVTELAKALTDINP